jgi:sulfopyruvate decarboxylase TPP-binding subunit
MSQKPQGASRAGYTHDMGTIKAIHQALRDADISFAAYLPDTLNYPLAKLLETDPDMICVNCSREDEGVAMAMGAFLGGRWPVLLTEGSGLDPRPRHRTAHAAPDPRKPQQRAR